MQKSQFMCGLAVDRLVDAGLEGLDQQRMEPEMRDRDDLRPAFPVPIDRLVNPLQ